MIEESITILKGLQYPSGLFAASKKEVSTGYNKAWLRDCIYEILGLEVTNNINEVKKAVWALFDVFLKHEYKIDYAIQKKPEHKHQYIHARYDPITFEEFSEDWGNKQNDAIGAFLFKVGNLEQKGIKVIMNEVHKRILQKLVHYLSSIEYWQDKDNGMWEENEEVHSSSVGACVAGLKNISDLVVVHPDLIKKGEDVLNELLPKESKTKDVDLALLSLIYPYNIVSDSQAKQILKNIEEKLVKDKGVCRYIGDYYYNNGGDAQWTMGLPWLAIVYKQLGNMIKYEYYMKKSLEVMNDKNELPELYYANSLKHNENTPLGWAQSMYLVAAVK